MITSIIAIDVVVFGQRQKRQTHTRKLARLKLAQSVIVAATARTSGLSSVKDAHNPCGIENGTGILSIAGNLQISDTESKGRKIVRKTMNKS